MSGIYGIRYNSNHYEFVDIAPMKKWNMAYGKNGEELYTDTGLHMGCFMEKLSDSAVHSNPVLKKNDKIAVLDVILYNREELVAPYHLKEEYSDEELLFDYIEKQGPDALKHVNGDFAGVIYDQKSQRLLLFRDHMGVRPLFYQQNDSFVAFSTDLRGMTALPETDATISEDWIFKIVAGYSTIGTENTEFSNIFAVAPAQYIVFSFEENTINKQAKTYWRPGTKKIRYATNKEYQEQLRSLVTDAVNRRLRAISGLIGGELSGGLDSSIIDILINRAGRDGVYFSWSSDPDNLPIVENDERLIIEDICRQENITCNFSQTDEYLGENSIIAENLRNMGLTINMNQLPALRYALPPYINALTICETAQFIHRSGANVVFTGHSGDEGISHRCNPYELFFHKEYRAFFQHFWQLTKGQPRRLIRTLKHCRKNLLESKKRFGSVFHRVDGVPELLKQSFAQKYRENDMPFVSFAYDPKSYILSGGSCNRLYNISLLGAYCGVRYIAPFTDYRLIDFAVSIPRSQYLQNNTKRYIYREAFKDLMPESLYVLSSKESRSEKSIPLSANWYETFAEKKKEVFELLDREFWGNYLDYSEIDAWMQRGEPSDEERFREKSILTCLFYCAMVQNLVEKSRS